MHVIAAKALALKEALEPDFAKYQKQVLDNSRAMAGTLTKRGYDIVSGGTDNHLFLVSLIKRKVTGKDADAALGAAHMTVNKNGVPGDPRPPMVTSGLRIGTPAMTTRGMGEQEAVLLGNLIADVLDSLASRVHQAGPDGSGVTADAKVVERVRGEVTALCQRFPVYR